MQLLSSAAAQPEPARLARISLDERYRHFVTTSPEAMLICRADVVLFANAAAARLLGVPAPQELIGSRVFQFIEPAFHAAFKEQAVMPGFQDQIWQRCDGSRFDAEVGLSSLYLEDHAVLQVTLRDVSARKRAQALQLGQNRILDMIATGENLKSVLLEIARFSERLAQRGRCSILTLDPAREMLVDLVAPSLPGAYRERVAEVPVGPRHGSCGTAVFRGEPVMVTDIRSDPLWETWRAAALESGLHACTAWPIFGHNRKTLGSFALYFEDPVAPAEPDLELFRICTRLAGIAMERHAKEQHILRLAHYDSLTGLPNRFLFREYLNLALQRAQRRDGQLALLFLDLDRFKEINDSLGHDAGDRALCEIAARLQRSLRDSDRIARMGGDEFYVLIDGIEKTQDAGEVARKLVAAAAQPLQLGPHRCTLGASIGIALYPQDGSDTRTLLRHADGAMYRAKAAGRNTYRFHADESAATVTQGG